MNLRQKILLLSTVVLASGCDLFNITDAEGTRGRGATAFDPYSSSASGALSLTLLQFNGCAMLPNGEPVSRGSLELPGYPEQCRHLNDGIPLGPERPPSATFQVTPGALYFLREFTAMDMMMSLATMDPVQDDATFNDWRAPTVWMRRQSRFKSLDWGGLAVGREEWKNLNNDASYQREIFYENAGWMLSDDDTFTLEVLDAGGTVRSSTTYKRKDFLAETHVTGRTRVSFTTMGLTRPLFPNDPSMHVDLMGPPPVFLTGVKVSLANSTDPFKSFRMPQLTGEGVIRVTWSLMPEEPFLFPVTFVPEQSREPSCYKLDASGLATTERVPCGFGLQQAALISRPANGKFFQPGETVDFTISLRDGDGNGLHSRDGLPSYNQYMAGESNGIAYFNDSMLTTYRDASSSESGFKVVGPLQEFRPVYGTYTRPYFSYPQASEPYYYLDPGAKFLPRAAEQTPPARWAVKLPPDAKPGTYAIFLKGHRNFMGERLNRLEPFFFQVGQEQATTYPGRVGNCQMCHNGVNSLSNLHHGMSVDNVEACTTCHNEESIGFLPDTIHRIHMGSRKYAQNKQDCRMCHLTKESTVRPSMMACNGCHLQSHGTEFFDMKFAPYQNAPNAYGNCAQACHVSTPPARHILPEN
ncbi:hypothetical protein ACN28I_17465 [Archangium gephyra]|uniref:hypothetical protein n=1 Tax=Archangium gephyra TaxID=48 RepID=UPI003B7E8E47